ncbi:MAG: response regulator [Gammaproteobacteria bacterium]|nr:response regulator [Gammaproteobacteria bacterium]
MESISVSDLLVLLVEPSTTQQRVIRNYLIEIGVRNVDAVTSGEEALTTMMGTPPDLVVSAMHLSDMTGADLVTKMRGQPRLADVPFMLVSSETSVRLLEPIRQAGVVGILPKPFTMENLRSALVSAVDMLDLGSMMLDFDVDLDGVRVLIVDDSLTSRRHIRRILQNIGVDQIVEAENGREGMAVMQQHVFDLILTDYNMPEMDGKEFVCYVRQQSSQTNVPILMVTSMQDEARLAQVEQVGVSAICDKPFEPRFLVELLRRVLVTGQS